VAPYVCADVGVDGDGQDGRRCKSWFPWAEGADEAAHSEGVAAMRLVPVEEPKSSSMHVGDKLGRESHLLCSPLECRRRCEVNKADGQRLQKCECSWPVASEATELCVKLPGRKLADLLIQVWAMTGESAGRCYNPTMHLLDGIATGCAGATYRRGDGDALIREEWLANCETCGLLTSSLCG